MQVSEVSSEHSVPDEAAQMALGESLAVPLRNLHPLVIFLEGNLGAGKTTLVRGLLRGLGYLGPVRSPTYTLIEPYEIAGQSIVHLDLYRLGDPEELEYLGLRDLIAAGSTLLVEWPRRGYGALPEPDIRVDMGFSDEGRQVKITGQSADGERLVRGTPPTNP
jgi:tRNA threonylcarbamoyladenosine biosynthesis protein TsaE